MASAMRTGVNGLKRAAALVRPAAVRLPALARPVVATGGRFIPPSSVRMGPAAHGAAFSTLRRGGASSGPWSAPRPKVQQRRGRSTETGGPVPPAKPPAASGGGGGGGGDGGGSNPWAMYMRLLGSHPLATKAATSAALNGLGDAIAQVFFGDGAAFDWRRCGTFTLLGGALVGPVLHLWYSNLGRIVTGTGAKAAAAKLALDQLVFAPAFLCVFLGCMMTLEGNAAQIVPKIRQDWASTVVANWKIWVPFQFLNFRFVPPNLQVGAANVVALLWNVVLSFASHKEVAAAAAPPSKKR